MPSAVCYAQALYMEPIKVLKINSFSSRHQRPGEKWGLEEEPDLGPRTEPKGD